LRLGRFIGFCRSVGVANITDITRDRIRDYLLQREADGLAEGSIDAAFRAISAFLHFCVDEGLISDSLV
jgi:site-specific recombinase XerD